MNREIIRLLALAGYPDANDPALWRRVVMLHNYGAVPRPDMHDPDYVWRGFHLLLLDHRGHPRYFAKCRAADDEPLALESQTLAKLSADAALKHIIPACQSARSDRMLIQLSRWVPGPTLERIGPRLGPSSWKNAVQAILDAADLVAGRAEELLPNLMGSDMKISPALAARKPLEVMERKGVSGDIIAPIQEALQKAPLLNRRLQHGDLWPGNVIQWDGTWWLLDFEVYGRVQIPLYDVLHLLRANPGRDDQTTRWLSAGPGGHRPGWSQPSRVVLSGFAARMGLSPAAVGGAYLYYLVEFTARMHGRGAPPEFRAPYLNELRLVAADLESGLPLEALVPLPEVEDCQDGRIER